MILFTVFSISDWITEFKKKATVRQRKVETGVLGNKCARLQGC